MSIPSSSPVSSAAMLVNALPKDPSLNGWPGWA